MLTQRDSAVFGAVMVANAAGTVVDISTEEYRALRKEIGTLKEGQDALRKDMQELKKLIMSRPAGGGGAPEFKEAIINIKGAPVVGDKNAKLVFMEFTDYQ